MTIWFTSDTHFRHQNIIRYCTRPFGDIEFHDQELIKRWNNKVHPDDVVYHLGDFAFGSPEQWQRIIESLNGCINLVKGNHDHSDKLKKLKELPGKNLNFLGHYHEIKVDDEEMDVTQVIVLFHYPIESWNKRHHGSWHLHGHCHGSLTSPDYQARLDVSVDNHDYSPIGNIGEIVCVV